MPSENTFKSHIEIIRKGLKNFEAVKSLDAPVLIKSALEELVTSTSGLAQFVPFFSRHALYMEVVPLAHSALADFFSANPSFEKPSGYKQVFGLDARLSKETVQPASAKRGMFFFLFILIFLLNPISFSLVVFSCHKCGQSSS